MKEPISSRLLTESILQVIENLTLPCTIQIRDKCNDIIIQRRTPELKEPEEFKTWRVMHSETAELPTFGRQWVGRK